MWLLSISCGELVFSARGSISVRFGSSAGYAARNRSTMARVAGSVASGVRSSARGTSTLPFTLPRDFCWLPSIEKNACRQSGAPSVKPYWLSCAGLISYLEERARSENTVLVALVKATVKPAARRRRQVLHGRRGIAELGAEVAAVGTELLDDRYRRTQPHIQLFQGIVVDEIEVDVFVAAAFARSRVGLSQ